MGTNTVVELNQLISLFNAIVRMLKAAAEHHGRRDAAYKRALLAVYAASGETKSYVTGLKQRKHPDREREAKLVRLWNEAAVELRGIDHELADKCLLHADFLAGATQWSDPDIDRARESLRELFEQARRLL